MTCKYLTIQHDNYPVLEGGAIRSTSNICLLKSQNKNTKLAVYQALFEKGLEDSTVSLICPVALNLKFIECPFYKS